MFSSSSEDENDKCYQTPRKKRYRKTLKHGLNKKRAKYHGVDVVGPRLGLVEVDLVGDVNERSSNIYKDAEGESFSSSKFDSSESSTKSRTSELSDTTSSRPSAGRTTRSGCDKLTDSDTDSTSSDTDRLISDNSESISITDSDHYINDSTDTASKSSNDFIAPDYDVNDVNDSAFIFEGCPQTYLSSYTLLMLLVTKHSLTEAVFKDLLQFTASHLPSNCKYSTSTYKVKQFLKSHIHFDDPKTIRFCEICNVILEDGICASDICRNHHAKVFEFHDLNFEKQLLDLFRERSFCEYVLEAKHKWENRSELEETSTIGDVCDGSKYKELVPMNDFQTIHLTFTMNTDGVTLFSSSKKGNLWPVYISINEIPIKLRFSKKYIIPCLLFCQVEKPNMLTYMSQFMTTLKKISDQGLAISSPFLTGINLVKGHLLMVPLDLPAKALVANMKQFNGKFGCSVCLDQGASRPNAPMHRYWPYEQSFDERTEIGYRNDVRESIRLNESVNGIKGSSALMLSRMHVNVAQIFPVDWMHCVLLGITKGLLKLWLGYENKSKPFYFGGKIQLMNQRLMKIHVPDFVARKPRSLEDHSHWKATEYREWLFHYSVPVLNGIISSDVLYHYSLLVSAMFLLNKETITDSDLRFSEISIDEFCKLYPQFYGEVSQTMNVHLLRHIPHFVKLYGPLFTFSCFGFESMNNHLKKMVHGTRYINNQVSFAVRMTKELPVLSKQIVKNASPVVRCLASNLTSKFLREDHNDSESHQYLGKPSEHILTAQERNLFSEIGVVFNQSNVKKLHRVKLKSGVYYSQHYKRAPTRNSYTVKLNDCTYGIILYFLMFQENIYAIMEKLNVQDKQLINISNMCGDLSFINTICPHIHIVKNQSVRCIYHISSIVTKCVFMEFDCSDSTYISEPPNLLEHN